MMCDVCDVHVMCVGGVCVCVCVCGCGVFPHQGAQGKSAAVGIRNMDPPLAQDKSDPAGASVS